PQQLADGGGLRGQVLGGAEMGVGGAVALIGKLRYRLGEVGDRRLPTRLGGGPGDLVPYPAGQVAGGDGGDGPSSRLSVVAVPGAVPLGLAAVGLAPVGLAAVGLAGSAIGSVGLF